MDTAGGLVVEEFKASYGGDQEDDVPAAGAKRSAGGSVRGVGSWHVNGLQQYRYVVSGIILSSSCSPKAGNDSTSKSVNIGGLVLCNACFGCVSYSGSGGMVRLPIQSEPRVDLVSDCGYRYRNGYRDDGGHVGVVLTEVNTADLQQRWVHVGIVHDGSDYRPEHTCL